MIDVRLEHTDDDKVNRNLRNLVAGLQRLARNPLADHMYLVEDQALTTSDSRVYHGLGRTPKGWFVVKRNAGADVFEVTASDDPNEYINLRGSASVTVTLLFF